MGKTKFMGYRFVDYTNKTGRNVKGYSLYFAEERNGVEGVACYDSWVSIDTFTNHFACIPIGSSVELSYNRFGNICGCSLIFDN